MLFLARDTYCAGSIHALGAWVSCCSRIAHGLIVVCCSNYSTSLGTVNRVLRVLSHSFYSATPPCVRSNNRVSVQFVPKRTRLSSSDKRGDTIISHFPIVLFQNDD
jgi:hypothetical protein